MGGNAQGVDQYNVLNEVIQLIELIRVDQYNVLNEVKSVPCTESSQVSTMYWNNLSHLTNRSCPNPWESLVTHGKKTAKPLKKTKTTKSLEVRMLVDKSLIPKSSGKSTAYFGSGGKSAKKTRLLDNLSFQMQKIYLQKNVNLKNV